MPPSQPIPLVADESVDFNIVKTLRSVGYPVYSIQESNSGISDLEVLEIAVIQKAILITEDKDFGEIVFRQKKSHFGILLIRFENKIGIEKWHEVATAFDNHIEDFAGSFTVISDKHIRIKKTANQT